MFYLTSNSDHKAAEHPLGVRTPAQVRCRRDSHNRYGGPSWDRLHRYIQPFTPIITQQLPIINVTYVDIDPSHSLILEGLNDNTPSWIVRLIYPFSITALQGAYTSLFAATSAEVAAAREKYKGAYLLPYGEVAAVTKEARDPALAKTLWETSERVVQDALERRGG